MNKNLSWKLGLIAATLLLFLFGLFGIPKEFSGSGLLAAIQDRIHLGLDLKGGTHLILQVQVNDAVNGDSDRALERSPLLTCDHLSANGSPNITSIQVPTMPGLLP